MHKYNSTNLFKGAIKRINGRAAYHGVEAPTLTFEGTVKLHGTNSSVYCDYDKEPFITQSRRTIVTPLRDNDGFSAYAHTPLVKSAMEEMFKEIKIIADQSEETKNRTAVIYGEWCGGNIKSGVALTGLERMFVVFAMKLVEKNTSIASETVDTTVSLEPLEDNTDSEDEDPNEEDTGVYLSKEQINEVFDKVKSKFDTNALHIHNIYGFKTWRIDIDMAHPSLAQNKLIEYTNEVEAECPVGKYFGKSGVGEGIVWRCVSTHPKLKVNDLTFKIKGQIHSVSKVKTLAPVDVEKVKSVVAFADIVATEPRLQQGMDYLNEMHLEVKMENMGHFLQWFCNDCIKEEGDILKASNLVKKDVTSELSRRAKPWFIQRVNEATFTMSPQSHIFPKMKKF